MAHLILPKRDLKELIRDRRAVGGDRYDEVWDGVYVMSPRADVEHQELATEFAFAIKQSLEPDRTARISAGTNVSDRSDRWERNFRIPDVAVFLPGNPAEDRGTHWFGGPDFLVEIRSKGDRSRRKFAFYAGVGVREFMVLDRRPWAIQLYRRDGDAWLLTGESNRQNGQVLKSDVLPLTFQLIDDSPRPKILLQHSSDGRKWLF
jgi:Uma2 family endonuclease